MPELLAGFAVETEALVSESSPPRADAHTMTRENALAQAVQKLLQMQAPLGQIVELLNSHGYPEGEVSSRAKCQAFAALARTVLADEHVQDLAAATLAVHALRTLQETFPRFTGHDRLLPPDFWLELEKRHEAAIRRVGELRNELHVKVSLLGTLQGELEKLECPERFDWPALGADIFPPINGDQTGSKEG